MATDQQIAANRLNAQKSTGPHKILEDRKRQRTASSEPVTPIDKIGDLPDLALEPHPYVKPVLQNKPNPPIEINKKSQPEEP